jgi:uncharacterized membrane protein
VLFSIFIILTVFVAGLRGMMSLIGMLFSFGVILKFILPQISAGHDPVAVAIGASFLIIPVTFYLSHGISGKTTVAVVGTILSLIVTGILASVFIAASKLTGFSSEEAGFLAALRPDMVSIQGLLLAGIIIGTLGILDDITISQSSIVEEIKRTDPNLNWRQVYSKAMRVGKDHISSLVNTLVLVYTGAALPLLLLFVNNPRPFSEIINYEMIAEEIVRTLVASIGLILAVPLTTFVACFFARKK